MDFPAILTYVVLFSGVVYLFDMFVLAPKRAANAKQDSPIKTPLIVEYARSLFPILFLVLVIRSFVVQPWRVPTGSLEPTVLPGDFIAVNQFAYGLRLPVLNTKIVSIGKPNTGDLAVFRWPVNPSIFYVKRVIGTPGDVISYKNKVLTINGQKASQQLLGEGVDVEKPYVNYLLEKQETLNGLNHRILINPYDGLGDDFEITVPKGFYFMMGDNRDASSDSRAWGFVPDKNLVGKPFAIILSWDQIAHRVRWDRFAQGLK